MIHDHLFAVNGARFVIVPEVADIPACQLVFGEIVRMTEPSIQNHLHDVLDRENIRFAAQRTARTGPAAPPPPPLRRGNWPGFAMNPERCPRLGHPARGHGRKRDRQRLVAPSKAIVRNKGRRMAIVSDSKAVVRAGHGFVIFSGLRRRPVKAPATTRTPSSTAIGRVGNRRGAGPPTILAADVGSYSEL